MTPFVEWDALANVVVVGLVVGAGLPALFALGVRALEGPGSHKEDGSRPLIRTVAAWACYGVVIAATLGAVVFIAAGGH